MKLGGIVRVQHDFGHYTLFLTIFYIGSFYRLYIVIISVIISIVIPCNDPYNDREYHGDYIFPGLDDKIKGESFAFCIREIARELLT